MSAKKAVKKGASYLVIDRPITQADDVANALQNFIDTINEK